ncbi:MAG: response regulator [Verrucomicrobia bacterium]|nr:response regulator [Verrucomicrobiota bacterium]
MKEQPHAQQPLPQAPAARILIVDDDTDVLDVFPHLFRPGQYAIAVTSRGSLALELAAHRTFDLAFVDYFMDDMNGVVVAQRLRHAQPHIQIVLMSGYTFDDKTEIMASSGARVPSQTFESRLFPGAHRPPAGRQSAGWHTRRRAANSPRHLRSLRFLPRPLGRAKYAPSTANVNRSPDLSAKRAEEPISWPHLWQSRHG